MKKGKIHKKETSFLRWQWCQITSNFINHTSHTQTHTVCWSYI